MSEPELSRDAVWKRLTSGGGREVFTDPDSRERKLAEKEYKRLEHLIDSGEADYQTVARIAVEETERQIAFSEIRQLRSKTQPQKRGY